MYYIVDIESKPNPKLLDVYMQNIKAPSNYKTQEAINKYMKSKEKEARKSMSVDTDFAEIFCIGVKERKEDGKGKTNLFELGELNGFILETLIPNNGSLVTFNGKQFDIPVIIKQGIKEGELSPKALKFLKMTTKKYQNDYHIDLMELVSNYGKPKSLDTYLQIYLGIKKKEIDFETCTDEELREHCLEDLENTSKLFNIFKPII